MREDGYCSVQILKSALAALESTAGRLSVSALAIGHSLTAGGRSLNLRAFPGTCSGLRADCASREWFGRR